ncbi:MAG: flagellin [Alphaproteobacteria bacterium]
MPMVINTNSSSLNAIQNLERNKSALTLSMEKLSSGLKINRAADDSAGLSIASRMAAQIGSLTQASANAQSGVSLINIADGALGSIASSLSTLRALAIQSANGTLTSSDRASINANAESLLTQINSVVTQTNFNGLNLLDGTLNTTLQVGTEEGDSIVLTAKSANTADIGAVIVNSDAVTTALAAGDLVINAAAIRASVSDGVSYSDPSASAIAIAAAINGNGTDLDARAVANPTVTDVSEFEESVNTGGRITVNGVATSVISINEHQDENVTNAINAVNALSNETGVVASANADGQLIFTAQDGRNITIEYGEGIENTDLGSVDAGTTRASVTLTSSKPITIGGAHPEHAGLTGGTTSTLTALDTADLSTQTNAIRSLAVIDGAIDAISDIRSNFGAVENRLYNAIENLSNNSVNLQDARSQIMDTDFAVEMANFAKLQIMQQAATSILAYANAAPQNVLKLLQ